MLESQLRAQRVGAARCAINAHHCESVGHVLIYDAYSALPSESKLALAHSACRSSAVRSAASYAGSVPHSAQRHAWICWSKN